MISVNWGLFILSVQIDRVTETALGYYIFPLVAVLLGVVVLVGILLIIRLYISLPGWVIAVMVTIWVLKDVALFPLVWRAYDWDRPGISRVMTGAVGVVKKPLVPGGFVQIDGELWKAKNIGSEKVVERGTPVRVMKRIGLTVHVMAHDAISKTEKEV